MNPLSSLVSIALAAAASATAAAPLQAPPPGPATTTDATMSIVNKRQEGAFTLRWRPARDAVGRERRAYDVLIVNCREVRSASGAPLPMAVGGRLHAVSGPPYAVLLSGCSCRAQASVHTAPAVPETQRSNGVDVRAGSIFGRPC